MSGLNGRADGEVLERATAALLAEGGGLPPGLDVATAMAIEARPRPTGVAVPAPVPHRHWIHRRKRMVRIVSFSGAVAATVAGVLLLWPSATSASTFEKAAANANNAGSYRRTIANQYAAPDGPVTVNAKQFDQDGRSRTETDSAGRTLVSIADFKAGKVLTLDPKTKTAHWTVVTPAPANPGKLFDWVADPALKPLPDETLGGKPVKVRAGTLKGEERTVYVDPATELPVRTRSVLSRGGMKFTVTTDYLGWGEPLDAALFEQTVPPGYTVTEAPAAK